MSWTMAKNCVCPSHFSCFSSISIKWCPKQLCIITQSTAPGRLISVAKNTMSSPFNVVMFWWACWRWTITFSSWPCTNKQTYSGYLNELQIRHIPARNTTPLDKGNCMVYIRTILRVRPYRLIRGSFDSPFACVCTGTLDCWLPFPLLSFWCHLRENSYQIRVWSIKNVIVQMSKNIFGGEIMENN